MNKLVNKYTKLIKSNRMTKNEINAMRKALGRSSSLNDDERQMILDAFRTQVSKSGGIKITKEHTQQGLNYLNRIAFTASGKMRNTKNYPFGDRECDVIRNFKEFRLVDLDPITNGFGEVWTYAAVWQVRGGSHPTFFNYVQNGQWEPLQVVG